MTNTLYINTLVNCTWNTLCEMKHNQRREVNTPTMLGYVLSVCPGV